MKPYFVALLLAAAAPAISQNVSPQVASLREAALKDDIAYEIVEGLTTEVGPRLAGTEAEARARAWAVAKLRTLGFSNVRVETFDMPVWVRGEEKAWITAPFPQLLVVTALGIEALEAAPDASVRGKIVIVSHSMSRTQDGSSYGAFIGPRSCGPTVASRKGAAAILIRSIGTDYHRNPHTGAQSFTAGVAPIPAGALAIPDAEQVQRILKRGKPTRLRLVMTPRNIGTRQSGNVIAEAPGRDRNAAPFSSPATSTAKIWALAPSTMRSAAGSSRRPPSGSWMPGVR